MATSEYLTDAQVYNPPSSPDLSFANYRQTELGRSNGGNWFTNGFGRLFHHGAYNDWVQNELNAYNLSKEIYDMNFQNSYQTYAADLERRRAAGMNGYYTDGVGGMQSAEPGHMAEFNGDIQNGRAANVFNALTRGLSSFLGFAQGLQSMQSIAENIKGQQLDNENKRLNNQYLEDYLQNRNNNLMTKYIINHMDAARKRWYLFGNNTPDGYGLNIMDIQRGVLEDLPNLSPYVTGVTANVSNQKTIADYNGGILDQDGIEYVRSMRKLQKTSAELDNAMKNMDKQTQERFFAFLDQEVQLYSARLANDITGEEVRGSGLALSKKQIEMHLKRFNLDNFLDYSGQIFSLVGQLVGMANTTLRTGAIMRGVAQRGVPSPQLTFHSRDYDYNTGNYHDHYEYGY